MIPWTDSIQERRNMDRQGSNDLLDHYAHAVARGLASSPIINPKGCRNGQYLTYIETDRQSTDGQTETHRLNHAMVYRTHT